MKTDSTNETPRNAKIKNLFIFCAGAVAGMIFLSIGTHVAMTKYTVMVDNQAEEWEPDYSQLLASSTEKYAAARTKYKRWISLSDVALWNVDAGSIDVAKRLARENLTLASNYQDDWNYGNAIHKANITLGRIALHENEVRLAGEFLIKAGKTPGSPQISSFGPNMILAKELLEVGEEEVVVEYLNLCVTLWSTHTERLVNWTEQVVNHEIPVFGGNLLF